MPRLRSLCSCLPARRVAQASRLPRVERAGETPALRSAPLRRRCCLAVLALGLVARAAEPVPLLPPLSGELAGEFTPTLIAGAPALKWRLTLRPGSTAAERAADLAIEGPGVRARGEVHLTALGEGRWRLIEAQVDVARWAPIVAPKYFPLLAGATVRGTLGITAEGTLHEGKIAGRAQLDLRDAAVRDAAGGWAIEGLALSGALSPLPSFASDGTFKLTFREATIAEVALRDGAIELAIDAQENVHVRRATMALLEGGVEVTPFSFPLAKPAIQTDVHFNAIELSRLSKFLPPVLTQASGRVSGRMALAWNAAEGIVPGSGRLQIDSGAAAKLTLAPTPGFLTNRVPQRLSLLPAWLGPVSKAFSPVNPAYETLRAIEMGEMQLEIDALDIGLRPDGDPAGRTARVVLTARPAKRDVVESVRFEVNVKGPLADVLRLGLEGKVKVRAR